jgi:GTP-binding protein HflX
LVVGVKSAHQARYEAEESLRELEALVATAGGRVIDRAFQVVDRPAPSTYLGTGKVEEIKQRIAAGDIDVVAVDVQLTARQVRNLETACECKVLDRSEVILDIFADHAQTHQARVQVELAQLRYTRGRLRRMWTHLGRAGGGIGTRGPGEKQLEVDRRVVRKRIEELENELTGIEQRKTREVAGRNRGAITVGLVGYTNAGKSTLMNALTDAGVSACDQLFHTLETRTRRWQLPGGPDVLLSDTVGFISNLPHHLIASFHATLEEATSASLLLHVVDAAHPEAALQMHAVQSVLHQLGLDRSEILTVFNKVDRVIDHGELSGLLVEYPDHVLVSALTGQGLTTLAARVARHVETRLKHVCFHVPYQEAQGAKEVERHGLSLERVYDEHGVAIRGWFWPGDLARLTQLGLQAEQL